MSADYQMLSHLQNVSHLLELNWTPPLDSGNPLVGRTIAESAIRARTGATVAGVIRQGILYPNPSPEFSFRAKDVLAVIGQSEAFQAFQKMARETGVKRGTDIKSLKTWGSCDQIILAFPVYPG